MQLEALKPHETMAYGRKQEQIYLHYYDRKLSHKIPSFSENCFEPDQEDHYEKQHISTLSGTTHT